jgi:hypothetical protein
VINIQFRFEVFAPTLEAIGAQIVASLQEIRDAVGNLGTQQGNAAQSITAQLAAIATETQQIADAIAAGTVDPAEVTELAGHIQQAANDTQQLAAQIQANTAAIQGMVPDEPPPMP